MEQVKGGVPFNVRYKSLGLGSDLNSRWLSECWTLMKICEKNKKGYCYVSQNRILGLLELYHATQVSRSTLNRDLRWLEGDGFIKRTRRIKRDATGKYLFRPTLYKLTGKLFNYLYLLGRRLKTVFSFFRVPKWTHHLDLSILHSDKKSSEDVGILWITHPDGSWEPKYCGKAPPLKA